MQIGWPLAKELLFTARVVEPEEAYRIGLLNHLVSAEQVMPKAMEIAKQIAANDARMVQGIKELMIQDVSAAWKQMYENELEAQEGKLAPDEVKGVEADAVGHRRARRRDQDRTRAGQQKYREQHPTVDRPPPAANDASVGAAHVNQARLPLLSGGPSGGPSGGRAAPRRGRKRHLHAPRNR